MYNYTESEKIKYDIGSDEYIYDAIIKIGKILFNEFNEEKLGGIDIGMDDIRNLEPIKYDENLTKQGLFLEFHDGYGIKLWTPFGLYSIGGNFYGGYSMFEEIICKKLGAEQSEIINPLSKYSKIIFSLHKVDTNKLPEPIKLEGFDSRDIYEIKKRWEKVSGYYE